MSEFIGIFGGGNGLPDYSLEFDGTNYLSLASADWGTGYTVSKKSVSIWIKRARSGVDEILYARYSGTSAREFFISFDNSDVIEIQIYRGSSNVGAFVGTDTITDTDWHHLLWHYDESQAASTRNKLWLDGSAASGTSSASNTSIRTGCITECGFATQSVNQYFSGKIYQPTYFDNYLASAAETYNGGTPRNLFGINGLYSMLNCAGNSPISDLILPDWTNNGSVVTSTDIP